ncbi:response regulator [Paenibacillus athensensis]|uniref:AraC family transcriptional regulator n=1 Tax=Paenibacillus athensensis TaxID=1967502 RepID=A0A4Y8Q5H1_9BACL|nr:response regulator [Paenibacillus athensensis]MCD1259489.1 response regulator [Paenibacillus athensensis]
MYNILVVDDEPMICKGIAAILLGSNLQISEVFIAHNGFEALDFLRLEQIDLVFTDIQMEKMNGIELIESIYLENPSLPIVILSAHGEFEYAQKAIRFGAKEYLVKPVMPDRLVGVARNLLVEKKTKSETLEHFTEQKKQADYATLNQNDILNELVTGTIDESEVDDLLKELDYRINGAYFCVITLKLYLDKGGVNDQEILTLKDRNLMKYASFNIIEETVREWDHLIFYNYNSTFSLILQLTEDEQRDASRANQLLMIAQILHNNLETYLKIRSVIGISSIQKGVPQWPSIYNEAVKSLSWGETNKGHYAFYIGDIGKYKNEETSENQIDEANNRFVYEAKKYIEQNYCNKGLKLQDIADSVHLSPNYLSYLFKRVMGTNIWDYVTKLRMDEGKRLILTTDKRRYEISEDIGYESPEHFSKIFKKYFGINISELKNLSNAN